MKTRKFIIQPERRIEPVLQELSVRAIAPKKVRVGGVEKDTDPDYHLNPRLNIDGRKERETFSALKLLDAEDIDMLDALFAKVQERYLAKLNLTLVDEADLPPVDSEEKTETP